MKNILIVLALFVLLVFAFGCDQKNPVIATPIEEEPEPVTITPTPEAEVTTFTLNGKVYQYDYLSGTSDLTKPLAQVNVTAVGTFTATTRTSAAGTYSFDALPIGQYTVTVSKESYHWHGQAANSASVNYSSSYYAGSTQEANFALDARPVFLGASISDFAEIPVSQTNLKLYFSKTMDTSTVTAFLKFLSLRTADVSGLSIPSSTIAWEDGNKTLSLTASSNFTADALYQAGVACSNAGFGIEGIQDTEGNPIYGTKTGDADLYNSSTDGTYGTYLYVPFKTVPSASSAPGKPVNLALKSPTTGSSEVNYDAVYKSSTGAVALQFDAVSGANGYRLYASSDNVTYTYVKEFYTPSLTVYVYDIVGALGNSCARGFDTSGHPIDPGLPWPFLGTGTYLKVSAYNSRGEGSKSDAVLAADTLPPAIITTAVEESDTAKVIKFSEPMDLETVRNKSNYTMVGAPAISTIEAVNDFDYAYTPYQTTYARIHLVTPDPAGQIKVDNVKDLSGNQIPSEITVTF